MAGEENLLSALGAFNVGQPKAASKAPTDYNIGVKRESLANAAAVKKADISGEPQQVQPALTEADLMKGLIAREEGTRASQEGFIADMGRLSDRQLAQKYGPDYQQMMIDTGYANRELGRLRTVDRPINDVIDDTVAGIVGGAGTTVAGIAALGQLENELTGVETPFTWLTQQAGKAGRALSETAKDMKSDGFKDIQRLSQMTNEVLQAETKAQQGDDLASGSSPLVAGLARIGRDVVGSADTLTDNPQLIGDLISENVAGLAVGAGVGNVVGKGAVAAEAAKKGLVGQAAEQFATRQAVTAASARAQPVIGAVQEAGGAADQAGQMVDALSDDEIRNSPLFKEAGPDATVADIRQQMHFNLTRDTAAVAGLTGLIGGQLTKGFDAAPLSPGSLAKVPVNMAGEAVEEALQGASGGLTENLSAQANIDENTDIAEGVGQQIAEGAIAGAGLAATMGGPGAVLASTVDATAGAANLANKGFQAVKKANENRVNAQYEADSPDSPEIMEPLKAEADAAVEAILTPAPVVGPEADAEPVAQEPASPIVETISRGYTIPDEELAEISPRVLTILQDEAGNIPRNRVDVINTLDTKFHEEGRSKEDKQFLASEIISNLTMLQSLNNDEAMAYAGGLDAADPVRQQYAAALGFSVKAGNKSSLRDAAMFLMENPIETNPITEDMDDNTALEQVQVVTATAQVNPVNIDPKAGQDILDLIGKRNLQVPEEQVRALRAAVDISRTTRLYSDAVRVTENTVTPTQRGYDAQEVSKQIVDTGWEGPRGQGKLSITQHATEIMSLVQQGKMEAAKLQMEDLDNFTQSQLNKTDAIDRSSKDGKRYNYDVYDPATRKFSPSKVAYGLTRNSANSFTNYEKIFTDTSLAVAVQNAMATQYPELGIEPRVMPNKSRSVAQREGLFKKSKLSAMFAVVPTETKAPKAEVILSKTKERQLIKESGGKKPLTALIAKRYGGIDPNSEVAKELRARGITAKANPGLFKSGGLKGLDNIVAAEEQHLAQTIGQEGDYLSLNGLLEALTNERDGVAVPVTVEQTYAMQELEARREEMDRLSQQEAESDEETPADSQPTPPTVPSDPVGIPVDTPVVEPTPSRANPLGTDDIAELGEPTPVRDLSVEYAATPKVAEYFKVKETSTSKVVGADSPVRVTQEALAPMELPSVSKAMEKVPSLVQKTAANLKTSYDNLIKTRTRDDIATLRNMRPINFADEGGNIDTRIVEAAAVAAINVALTVRGNPNIDVDEVMDINTGEGSLEAGAAEFIQDRMPEYQVIQNIARQTMDLLGISPKGSVSEADSRASFESLAAEMIANLAAEGVLDRETRKFKVKVRGGEDSDRSYSGVKLKEGFLTPDENKSALIEADKLTRLLIPDADPVFNINTPPKNLRQTQKGTGADLSKLQKKAVRFQSDIEYTPNDDFIMVVELIGEDTYNRIRGYKEITAEDEKKYNKNDLDVIKGKNNSIKLEYQDTMAALRVMTDEADENGPRIYFPHEVTRVGRMQQVGPANPQSNIFARSSLRSTKAKNLDLSDPINMEGFIRSLVQMSGVGKPEQLSPEYLMANGLNDIDNKYGPVIRELESLFSDQTHKLNINTIERVLSGSKPVVLESLIAVAKYNIADEAGRKAFPHTVPLEADGVTNGPAAVLMKFSTGPFSPDEIDQMQRVGFFFSEEPMAMHQKTAAKDTYEVTADLAKANVIARAEELDTDAVRAHRDAAMRFMKTFNPKGVTITADDSQGAVQMMWGLIRDAAKNPLTKTTYGAGKMGTARGITKDMVSKLYASMTNDLQNNDGKTFGAFLGYPGDTEQFRKDVKLLTSSYIKYDKAKGFVINQGKGGQILNQDDLSNYTFDRNAMESIAQNINAIYVDPLYQAVETTMGSSFVTMSKVIRAAQLQSSVMKAVYDQFSAKFGSRDTYSPEEYKAFEEKYKALGAYIEAQDQNFFIGGTKEGVTYYEGKNKGKAADRQRQLTGSVDNTTVQPGFRQDQPGFAGVSAAAFINIGTGDGFMMTYAHGKPVDGMERTLQVFDGQEMPADKFKELGYHMNQAAYEAWQVDTMQSITDSFESFARNITKDTMTKEMADTVIKEVFPYDEVKPTLSAAIEETLNDLREAAEWINARAEARAAFSTYTDQMAGANAPHHNKGKNAGSTNLEISTNLNKELFKIITAKKESVTAVENAELTARLEAVAETVTGDVKTVSVANLRKLFPVMSQQSKYFYRDIIANAIPQGLEVFYGPADQLEAYRQATYKMPEGVRATALTSVDGQYDPNNNVLFLVQDQKGNGLSETLLHEMTHVAIADKIVNYFANPQSMTPAAREAAQRLTILANDFLNLNFSKDIPQVKDRIKELRDLRNSNDTTSAKLVNEVIAVMLTNPDVSKVAKQTRILNPLGKIVSKAMLAIRKMLGMKTTPRNDYFSNARFNAEILTKANIAPTDGGTKQDVLNMLQPTGPKGAETSRMMRTAVDTALAARGLGSASLVQAQRDIVESKSYLSLIGFETAGFKFNAEEAKTFEQVMEVFMVGDARLNGAALVRAQEIVDSVLADLEVDDFMVDPVANDPNDRVQAEIKFKEVLGKTARQKTDLKNRSLVLPAFLALAASNSEFSAVLAKKPVPAKQKLMYDTTDQVLTSITQNVLDSLTNFVVGESKGSNAQEAVDNLIGRIANLEAEKQTALEQLHQNTYNSVEEFMVNKLDSGATALSKRLEATHANMKNSAARMPVQAAQMAVSLFSKREGGKSLDKLTTALNQKEMNTTLNELFSEIRGRTPDNAKIYDMINRVRSGISAIREEFREQVPKLIQANFKKKLNKVQWETMHKALGTTDVAGLLVNGMNIQQVSRLFSSNPERAKRITALSAGLNQDVIAAAENLADYMVNGNSFYMLRKNAYAISKLQKGSNETQISNLVSVYAIEKLTAADRKTMTELFVNEPKGIEYSLAQMAHFRRVEYDKTQNNELVKMNQLQGYIPAEASPGIQLVLVENSDHKRMAQMGYYRVGPYGGSVADPYGRDMSYYRTNVSSRNSYTQGVAQTVESSQNGVDVRTGRSVNGRTAGVISGAGAKIILKNISQGNILANKNEHLLPIFDSKGDVVAFERAIKPEMLELKKRDTHFGKMLGAMAGRQEEEKAAKRFNLELVNNVKAQYDADNLRHGEYVNLAQSKDKVHEDTWKAIPREMKDNLAIAFGEEDFFPVRRDMIPMVAGYRNAGLSDLWSGVSRLSDEKRKAATDLVEAVFGRPAYEYMMKATRFWTTVVSEAKVLIVVKSVIVPAMNLMSNALQLMGRGVPARSILTSGVRVFTEITKYDENQKQGIKLQADIRAENDPFTKARLQARLDSLKAANRRMSIWPLIEAGEYKTISEGLTDADVSLREGRFVEWIEKKVEELPEGIRTLGKYAVVSKTTALYKGMDKATQYGDFIAKAILYDDMVNRQKKSTAEAHSIITEEFVNYDVPAGRSRSFLEEYGLLMFGNYKIRSLKTAVRNMRDNPLRALMSTMLVNEYGFLGSPVTDNLIAVSMDGRLENAIGPGMIFRAPTLNPWYALTQ